MKGIEHKSAKSKYISYFTITSCQNVSCYIENFQLNTLPILTPDEFTYPYIKLGFFSTPLLSSNVMPTSHQHCKMGNYMFLKCWKETDLMLLKWWSWNSILSEDINLSNPALWRISPFPTLPTGSNAFQHYHLQRRETGMIKILLFLLTSRHRGEGTSCHMDRAL